MKSRWRTAVPALALMLAGVAAAQQPGAAQNLLGAPPLPARVESDLVKAELMAHAPQGAAPGQTVWLGLQLAHAPEWHTYWKNPGDSGLPTELQWTLPPGVTAGEVAWPTPRKFPLDTLANYGFDGTVMLPVPLTISPDFKGSHIDVQLYAAWLVCRKECIPEEGRFGLRVPVDGSTALHAQAFDAAFAAAPSAQPPGASSVQPEDGFINVTLDGLPERLRGQTLEFFPEAGGIIEPGKSWTQQWDGARWSAKVPLSPHRGESPATMALVVAQADPPGEGPGLPGVRLEVPVQGAWPAPAPLPTAVPDALSAALEANAARAAAAPATGGGAPLSLWAALIGALIGGALLNLMPCVFPVLAIKVLSFSQTGHGNAARNAHRVYGLAYTAGVVLSFLALGAVLLALRSAGEQLGWGFQLQSPGVVAALAVLFTLIGLNLAGLFEIGNVLPSRLATLQARNPTTDAFLTGVLASAIASPCTAPFMGASLGLAIGLPPVQALAVFGMLGLGMALPYLTASWVPAVARLLPRPGAWMQTFRQLMAFPMFATVVWLLWVLGQQSGIDGAAALLMLLVVLALVVWALGLRGRSRGVLAGLSLVGLVWLVWSVGPSVTRLQDDNAAATVATGVQGVSWEPWSPQRQAALLAEGRPVFIDFTAAWCVTCQYNKRTTLSDEALLADMAGRNVALLRADWTRRDPAVTEALARLGRNGIPVYAIYKNGQAPQVLSEIITVEEVRAALTRL